MDAIESLRYLKNRGFRRKYKMFRIPYVGDIMKVNTSFIIFWIAVILNVYDLIVFCKSQRIFAFIIVLMMTMTAQVYLPSEYMLKSFMISTVTFALILQMRQTGRGGFSVVMPLFRTIV
ncbi:PREDICTED: uncharacterized protein LOC108559771 [Nicrophorus vespilloides]|uniref:Uncharacterized protein LOC108559771 n=1 Tax=Nicrophorus vespilloides TaxID=110193 RepID=A0ABM1MDF7_NICVS|nr:PREDICTED: uncharacterized protein LOC108559771 [Nicrophorus vespilloides]